MQNSFEEFIMRDSADYASSPERYKPFLEFAREKLGTDFFVLQWCDGDHPATYVNSPIWTLKELGTLQTVDFLEQCGIRAFWMTSLAVDVLAGDYGDIQEAGDGGVWFVRVKKGTVWDLTEEVFDLTYGANEMYEVFLDKQIRQDCEVLHSHVSSQEVI